MKSGPTAMGMISSAGAPKGRPTPKEIADRFLGEPQEGQASDHDEG
jgi:hypothetical protein